jgi:hypothetical protein
MVLAVAFVAGSVPPVSAATGGYLGSLTVTAENSRNQISSGDENTQFLLLPPAGAMCPGDSAHDAWRINGYIIPANESIETTPLDGDGPSPILDANGIGHRMALYTRRRPYHWKFLPANDRAGLPAIVPAIPPFAMWDAARLRLAAGSYVMGVGCDFDGVVKQYWQVPVEIVRPDGPKGTTLKWSVPLDKQSSVLPNQSSSTLGWVLVGLAGVVVAGGAGLVGLVTRSRARSKS